MNARLSNKAIIKKITKNTGIENTEFFSKKDYLTGEA
jgi:hypothetical protein